MKTIKARLAGKRLAGASRSGPNGTGERRRRRARDDPHTPCERGGERGEGERYINLRHTHTHTPWERSTRERIFSDFDFGPSFSLALTRRGSACTHTHMCVCALSAHTPLFCMQFHIIIYYAYIEYVVCFFHNIMHSMQPSHTAGQRRSLRRSPPLPNLSRLLTPKLHNPNTPSPPPTTSI